MSMTLFSRTRPSTEALAAMLNRTETAAGGVDLIPKHPALAVIPGRSPVQDIKDVPVGRYTPFESIGIPSAFSESFALLMTGEKSAVLLTAVEAFSTHPQFELQRRLTVERAIPSIVVCQATREVVKILHEQNETVAVIANTTVEDKAWNMIEDALEKETSDIHIETRKTFAQLYFRIFGERIQQPIMSMETATAICNVLAGVHADAGNMGVDWNPNKVIDTVITYKTRAGSTVQLRFSSGPIYPAGNFHAVLRVLEMDEKNGRPLEDVGYTEAQVDTIEETLLGSQGLIGLIGPTNSGKSTSMQALIERTFDRRGDSIKVITVEDPVEYVIRRACQMGVNEGGSFKSYLKGTLRQDPDVVMAGEMRDADGTEHVMHLVLAGRKLFTSIHVYEVMAAFARLRELGIPESVLFMDGFIGAFICQRLVPLLCPNCRMPIAEAMQAGRVRKKTFDRVARVADLYADNICVRGDGCPDCKHRGIIGRTPCAEILVPDPTFLSLMAQGKLTEAKQHWMTNSPDLNIDGMGVTMMAHAIHKMRAGLLDPAHVENNIGKIIADVVPMGSGRAVQGREFPAAFQYENGADA